MTRRRGPVAASVRGFYGVLDRDDEQLARALIAGGARILQVRLKPRAGPPVGAAEVARAATMARRVCDDAGVALIVNDRVDVALAVDADGVHLGQTDLPIDAARALAGDRLWLGVSTHDLAQVRAACAAGADYLGFGPVFTTTTKANPDPVQGIARLRAAVEAAGAVPIVAIGGITVAAADAIYATGAAAICAISAVNEAANVERAGRALSHPRDRGSVSEA